jgi:hypothetical protein
MNVQTAIVNDRRIFIIDHCPICNRPSNCQPGWTIYESEIECWACMAVGPGRRVAGGPAATPNPHTYHQKTQ